MSPRLIASVLTTTAVCAVLVLAVLLAGCGGGDWPDEADAGAIATKPVAPNCERAGMCT